MRWSTPALYASILVIGLALGRMLPPAAPPPSSAPEALPAGEEAIDCNLVGRCDPNLDNLDRTMLELRKRQPIRFLGVPMRQIPTDNWLMNELLFSVKPDYIIEAGTLYGGSALYYAALLEFINPEGVVITVDIRDQIAKAAKSHPLFQERVRFIQGGSTDPDVIEQVARQVVPGSRVLVTLDTLHKPDHVRRELELYAPFVSRGSYLIVQDTYFDGLPEAIDDFLAANPDFQRSPELDDRFLLTKYRGGFLKRN